MFSNDKIILAVMMALVIAFKVFDLNIWKYDMLRAHHSKNYIRNNYTGIGEWIFFSKSIREIGVILPIVNFLILAIFAAQGFLMFMVFEHHAVRKYVAVMYIAFAVCCFLSTVMTVHNYTALGIRVKDSSANHSERVITTFSFTAIVCFFAFMVSRGALF